jgi:hypothetical protein
VNSVVTDNFALIRGIAQSLKGTPEHLKAASLEHALGQIQGAFQQLGESLNEAIEHGRVGWERAAHWEANAREQVHRKQVGHDINTTTHKELSSLRAQLEEANRKLANADYLLRQGKYQGEKPFFSKVESRPFAGAQSAPSKL